MFICGLFGLLIIKLSERQQRAVQRSMDNCLLLTGGEHEANQCTKSQSSITRIHVAGGGEGDGAKPDEWYGAIWIIIVMMNW